MGLAAGGVWLIEVGNTGGKTVEVAEAVAGAPLTDSVVEAVSVLGDVGTGPVKSQVAESSGWPKGWRTLPMRLGQMFMVDPLAVSVRAMIVPAWAFGLVTTTW